MTIEEFKNELKIINEKWEKEIWQLKIKFAKENDPYNIGDIIEDHIGKIKITNKKVTSIHYNDTSCMMYQGDNLTKSGTINKREPTRWVYQFNIIKI
jgi:hypothetical protein